MNGRWVVGVDIGGTHLAAGVVPLDGGEPAALRSRPTRVYLGPDAAVADVVEAGVANLVNLFNPEMVVVVGGVTRAGGHLFGPLRAEVRRRAFDVAVRACRIVPGALPNTAGVIGAAGIFIAERDCPE